MMSPDTEKPEYQTGGLVDRVLAHRLAFLVAAVVIAVFALGYFVGTSRSGSSHDHGASDQSAEKEALFWTCSMHPQIRQPGPGQCPLCAMDLIPVFADASEGDEKLGPRQIAMSSTARLLADIETAPVERRIVQTRVRMVGKVDYDETRLSNITAWVGGRLDRLYVDYTGVSVKKGDHLVWLYSPELLAAQEELLQSIRASRELASSQIESTRTTADATVTAVREKLRLLGLNEQQVADIESSQKVSDHFTIYAPVGGIVVHKNAVEGMYVTTGSRIYTIADLTHVWVKLDAYESDLPWIRYGQKLTFQTEAYPGETFEGRIAFIDPVLDSGTRTTKIRVNVPNAEGRLKPGMFVRAVVNAGLDEYGKAVAADLAGKWISPMHPEIVKDAPGVCDICGMPLVRAETLGFVSAGEARPPLVIPATAPLITGERAVVYVAVPDTKGVFEGREVVLGPRAGDFYVVKENLREGELVVIRGNFKIDSALQIIAKSSMMNPDGAGPAPGRDATVASDAARADGAGPTRYDVPPEFIRELSVVFDAYFGVQTALSSDDHAGARRGAEAMAETLSGVEMSLVSGPAHMAWMKELGHLKQGTAGVAASNDLTSAREAFHGLSEAVTSLALQFGDGKEVYQSFCPMAFGGRGAHWLAAERQISNPYFGASMLTCGEVVKAIPAAEAARDEGGGSQ